MPTTPSLSSALPAAVLWDMDGTLIDSEVHWMSGERALVESFGGTWTDEDALEMIGSPLPRAAKILQDRGVALPTEEIVTTLLDGVARGLSEYIPWRPGALELLGELREAGVPCALVTMSYRQLTDIVAAEAGAFDVVVTGEMVRRGKPDPEPYLTAADRLGVDIRRCVAIEDSPVGVGSALASGAATIGVQHIAPILPAAGLSRVSSLTQVTLEGLGRIAAGNVVDLLAA